MRDTDFLEPIPQERKIPAEEKRRMRARLAEAIESDHVGYSRARDERKARRHLTFVAVVLLSLLGVGAAWALTRQPEQTTEILCPENLVTSAVSGDPVVDCARVLREVGIEPPEMMAYANDAGGVVVIEAGVEAPEGWQPLGDDFRQDLSIIELEAALNDVSTGLDADCYSTEEAVPLVEQMIDRFGFEWTVDVAREADGQSTCAISFLQPETFTVGLTAVEGSAPGDDQPWIALGNQLNEALEKECLDIDEAVDVVEGLVHELDMKEMMSVTQTTDEQEECTRATVTVGGLVFVDLRGPANN